MQARGSIHSRLSTVGQQGIKHYSEDFEMEDMYGGKF